jgi:Asp-tRNA(Asn)/Glu-tRNA(Gln) amidotransferase A subunit family amidase
VPRTGCMALSWTMDKVGPLARSIEDCALVLEVIAGAHPGDPDAVDAPLSWIDDDDLAKLRIGYVESAFAQDRDQKDIDDAVLAVLRKQGLTLTPMEIPDLPVWDMMVVLEVEAASAFDELTVSGRDDEMVRQVAQAWPNIFRAAQLVPAVQYVQAQRARTRLMRAFEDLFADVDVYVAPAFVGNTLGATNLTGHPCVVVPDGFTAENLPTSITFIGGLYQEGRAVALARVYQRATDWHLRHPDL